MTDQRRQPTGDDTPLSPTLEPEEVALDVAGTLPRDEQEAYVTEDQVDKLGEITDTDIYEGELEAGVHDDLPGEPVERNLDLLTETELRAEETDNPDVAAEEGFTWVPPSDPPVIADAEAPGGAEVAAGFGSTALDEPYDESHRGNENEFDEELRERVHEALRADASTSFFADRIVVGIRGTTAFLRGTVDDVDDSDNAVAVVERVDGIEEVVDQLDVAALDDQPAG